MLRKYIIPSTLFKIQKEVRNYWKEARKLTGPCENICNNTTAIPEGLIEIVLYKYFCLKLFQLCIMFLSLLAKLHKVLNSRLFQLRKQSNSFPFDMCGPELASMWQLGCKVYRDFQDKMPFEIKGIRYQIMLTFPVPFVLFS